MFNSPFKTDVLIEENTKVVFVADMFINQYVGGAELTTDALIKSSKYKVQCVNSKDVTMKTLESGHRKYWIFGNFSQLDVKLIPTVVANLDYSILEYDYKFCKYRSIEKHLSAEQKECDCHEENYGKMISAFFYGAKSLWFMSEAQQKIYFDRFPFLNERENWVLSSVFDDSFFLTVKMLREKYKEKERKGWLVVGSSSWIKGTQLAIEWCKENNKEYKIIQNWPYGKVLEEMAQAEGLVYLPPGGDTCPRTVIEAKILGCQLELNENVQHKDEEWFSDVEMIDTESYLFAAREKFWASISNSMAYIPTLSGYTTTLNCNKNGYPWKQSISSLLGFCNEVIVVDGGSTDGTWAELEEWAKVQVDGRLKVYQVKRDWESKRFAVFDGLQKAEARKRCTMEYCWQQDADEVVHEDDYQKVKSMLKQFPKNAPLICLPVIEYWGSAEKVRMDVNPWKWRLSKNLPNITHGIPGDLVMADKDGNIYAKPGTDGCDYIDPETFERTLYGNFYSGEIHKVRLAALQGNKEAIDAYTQWFKTVVENYPSVYHYSWFDIERKIKTYKNYWQKHWESLYDIKQEDVPENNMFFQKQWSSVTDEDIKNLSVKLAKEIGGWVFHSPVNFENPTPHIVLNTKQPALMIEE